MGGILSRTSLPHQSDRTSGWPIQKFLSAYLPCKHQLMGPFLALYSRTRPDLSLPSYRQLSSTILQCKKHHYSLPQKIQKVIGHTQSQPTLKSHLLLLIFTLFLISHSLSLLIFPTPTQLSNYSPPFRSSCSSAHGSNGTCDQQWILIPHPHLPLSSTNRRSSMSS